MTGRTQLVELVEDDDSRRAHASGRRAEPEPAADDPAAPAPPEAGDRARAWLRRHWRWLVPSAAVVVAALVVTQGVVDARERERAARLAALPGVLAPVDRDLTARWRASASLGSAIQSGTEIGDRVVAVLDTSSGGLGVAAIDVRTGRELWRTPVDRPARPTGSSTDVQQLYTFCSSAPHGTGEVALCGAQEASADGAQPPPTALWVVDPADGTVLARHTVPGTAASVVAGPDLVTATAEPGTGRSRSWRLVASDLVTGERRWTFTTPPVSVTSPYAEPGGSTDELRATPTLTTTLDEHVVVGSDSHLWQLSPTGTVERSLDVRRYSWVEPLRGGVLLTNVYGMAPVGARQGDLVLADGTRVPTDDVGGYLAVDDGSAPEMTFTATTGDTGLSGVKGRLAATGAVVWTHAGQVQSALLLEGRLYLAQSDGVVALDARTGRELWSAETDYSVQEIGTDGTSLLVPGPSATLTAYALSSGHELWSRGLGAEVAGPGVPVWTVQSLDVAGQRREVVGWMDDGSVVFLG